MIIGSTYNSFFIKKKQSLLKFLLKNSVRIYVQVGLDLMYVLSMVPVDCVVTAWVDVVLPFFEEYVSSAAEGDEVDMLLVKDLRLITGYKIKGLNSYPNYTV